jgi:hypothetical protein
MYFRKVRYVSENPSSGVSRRITGGLWWMLSRTASDIQHGCTVPQRQLVQPYLGHRGSHYRVSVASSRLRFTTVSECLLTLTLFLSLACTAAIMSAVYLYCIVCLFSPTVPCQVLPQLRPSLLMFTDTLG